MGQEKRQRKPLPPCKQQVGRGVGDGGGGVLDRRGVLDLMHGRSRMERNVSTETSETKTRPAVLSARNV